MNSKPVLVYRMTAPALSRTRANPEPLALQTTGLFGTPPSEEPLSGRAMCVLEAMLMLGAINPDHRQTTEDIAEKALGKCADANALKGVMAELKTRKLIESKTGRGGGYWLTESGRVRAEKLRKQPKTPQPFRHLLRTD